MLLLIVLKPSCYGILQLLWLWFHWFDGFGVNNALVSAYTLFTTSSTHTHTHTHTVRRT